MQFELVVSCQDAGQPMFLETIAVTFILACVETAVQNHYHPTASFQTGGSMSRALLG